MIKTLITEFPVTTVTKKPTNNSYTKEEVDQLIKCAVNEAKRIDDESMRKHNREATMISMALGFTTLALFVDGLLRLLGIVPPFMDINISIIDEIINKLSL